MTKIITHLRYTDLFRAFERSGIILPSSMLERTEEIERQLEYLLHDLNPVELIQFSSFLNMICQSCGTEISMARGIGLLKEAQLAPGNAEFANRILFHRENLLSLMGHIISRDMSGTSQLTGPGQLDNQKQYVRAILLNNDLLNREATSPVADEKGIFIKDYFIKEWPHYYISEISQTINAHRIVRYRYCYESLLPSLKEPDRRMMQNAISAFEERVGASLGEYFYVIIGLFGWFLDWPQRRKGSPLSLKEHELGFDFQRLDTFYISSRIFESEPSFIKIIGALSKNIAALKIAAKEEQERARDPISGHNKFIRVFFDNPIFKISDDLYCIIDLKFLLENVCGGLLWRLRAQENLQDFKSAYGHLMEGYFRFLINRIFEGAQVTFGKMAGADAIAERDNYVLVFEFTTEYYRFSALYNSNSQQFMDDAYRVLFNTGKEDPRSRNKKDKGKMIKLNDYLIQKSREGKTIIPVLVTENFIGSSDLFNECSGFFQKELVDKKLLSLQDNPPIFLCLDDLELFWAFSSPKDAIEEFAAFAQEWIGTDKGPYFHSAASGICSFIEKRRGEARISNEVFADFFSPSAIYRQVSKS